MLPKIDHQSHRPKKTLITTVYHDTGPKLRRYLLLARSPRDLPETTVLSVIHQPQPGVDIWTGDEAKFHS